jgi:phosphoribosyl-ATP pyrophosphohydrolase
MDLITELGEVLRARRDADPHTSYVASLYAAGLNKILEKIGEEATEVILASRDLAQVQTRKEPRDEALAEALACEVADLWFHSMVMLTHQNIPPQRVLEILGDRFGVSGIEEKRNR